MLSGGWLYRNLICKAYRACLSGSGVLQVKEFFLLNPWSADAATSGIINTFTYKFCLKMEEKIKLIKTEILSDNWYTLKKITYEYKTADGNWQQQEREAYDRGNGATILLYNKKQQQVLLTRQFRLPTFINGNPDGMLIEACAGLLDEDNPEDCIRRETEEETGYRVSQVKKIFEAYMSPGSVTEILHFFIAEYERSMKVDDGGGVQDEQEHIEVLELPVDEAMHMVKNGGIRDAKTIMLLQYVKLNGIM
jgi:nudix-type nucleoside diphosphatase (YffH/AdpP family)